jgi:hypothetical protein
MTVMWLHVKQRGFIVCHPHHAVDSVEVPNMPCL